MTKTMTQEDIERYGLGCKSCGETTSDQGWFEADGDLNCWTCALRHDALGATVTRVNTEAQEAELVRWAGIGTD